MNRIQASFCFLFAAAAVTAPAAQVHADVSIDQLQLVSEKAAPTAQGNIELKTAFKTAGLPPEDSQVLDDDPVGGTYPAQYASSSYPSQYASSSYPSQYAGGDTYGEAKEQKPQAELPQPQVLLNR
jgi:hypothetical protein